jgi:hypothetical protein
MIMKRILCIVALASLVTLPVRAVTPPAASAPQTPQEKLASRNATREKLRALLAVAGARKDVNVAFRQSDKQPYNFLGVMDTGLTNCDSLEIVIGVSDSETIGIQVYPHYKGSYINLDKARNSAGLMRRLLNMSSHNFLFFAADDTGDVYAGYTFTLESGFPDDAMTIVIRSIRNTDKFVGELRPMIDGTTAP